MTRRSTPTVALDIMIASLSQNSLNQYDVYLKKWWIFCQSKGINIYDSFIPNIIEFFTKMYNDGNQYGSMNSCRSALSLLLGPEILNNDLIQRFFKGVFRLRRPLPKYNSTWDTNLVLNHLSEWFPNEDLPLEKLSKKTITLMALTTAHRMQTLSLILIQNIEVNESQVIIKIPDEIKTTRLGSKQPLLILPFFSQKPSICPAKTLLSYLEKTKDLRKNQKLFIGVKKPYNSVGAQTLSRWVKKTLDGSGIDIRTFSAHSTRHASSSRAYKLGVNLDTIRNTAGWSESSHTFGKFYCRTVINKNNDSLARAILNDNLNN